MASGTSSVVPPCSTGECLIEPAAVTVIVLTLGLSGGQPERGGSSAVKNNKENRVEGVRNRMKKHSFYRRE